LKTLVILGLLLLLAWLFLYFKFFRNGEGEKRNKGPKNIDGGFYSVAPWGDNSNSGSLTDPWQTLQHAVDNLQPGDRLLIREGVYRERVFFKNSGTSGNPIVVSVFNGEEAVLDGGGVAWKYGFNFEFGVSFVTLSGLKIKNFGGYGIALWGENRFIQLDGIEVAGCGVGLHIISAGDLLVENCNLHNNSGPGLVVSPGPLNIARFVNVRSSSNESAELPDGFVLDSGEEIVFEKCVAEYNAGSGFRCLTSNTVISESVSRENGSYGVKCLGEGHRLINCIIDGNGRAGVTLQGGGVYGLYNNLIVNCGRKGDYGIIAAPDPVSSPARLTLVNNILAYNYGGVHLSSSTVLEKEDHNIYWSREDAEISDGIRSYSRSEINEGIWFEETGKGEHSFCRDPLFVDKSCRDFRLAKNSPAVDRGAKEDAPGRDFNGNPRPQGRGVDIGPYESAEESFIPPKASITYSPVYSSDCSGSVKFSVRWAGSVEGGACGGFNVQFRDGNEGNWQNWFVDTSENEGVFSGVSGHTYYFRVQARDDLGNWGNWSDVRYTVVPADDRNSLIKYEGVWDFVNSEGAFLNTLHHSSTPGAAASFRFTGTCAAWISTRGPDRGQALVYIDDVLQGTVDLYCDSYRHRAAVFSADFDGVPCTHTIRVEVAETKNHQSKGCRVDIDGFAVRT